MTTLIMKLKKLFFKNIVIRIPTIPILILIKTLLTFLTTWQGIKTWILQAQPNQKMRKIKIYPPRNSLLSLMRACLYMSQESLIEYR
jgi:hypothetical protein